MSFRSFKGDINKIYQKIDKIAKVGRDNYLEYYSYIDDSISKGQYGLLNQVLLIKFNLKFICPFIAFVFKYIRYEIYQNIPIA